MPRITLAACARRREVDRPFDDAAIPALALLDMKARRVAGDWQRPFENRIRVGPLLVVRALEPLDDGAARYGASAGGS
jgi:hypothetical protein